MSTTARTPFIGTYISIYVGSTVAIIAAILLIRIATGYTLINGGTAILPPIIAAALTGRRWGRRSGIVPEPRLLWRFAIVASISTLALHILAALVVLGGLGPQAGDLAPMIAGVVVLFTLVTVFLNRWFVMFGARSAVKPKSS